MDAQSTLDPQDAYIKYPENARYGSRQLESDGFA